ETRGGKVFPRAEFHRNRSKLHSVSEFATRSKTIHHPGRSATRPAGYRLWTLHEFRLHEHHYRKHNRSRGCVLRPKDEELADFTYDSYQFKSGESVSLRVCGGARRPTRRHRAAVGY